jgi:hypothetical protein
LDPDFDIVEKFSIGKALFEDGSKRSGVNFKVAKYKPGVQAFFMLASPWSMYALARNKVLPPYPLCYQKIKNK